MKRSSASLAVIALLLAILPVSGLWAVWEGNAGIATVSEFPGDGLYAKSDMFPRNTIVEIENLETGTSVRAVITGSSGIAGLVAVLSPETASALNMQKGSVSRVRIRIPAPVGETPAEGLIASGSGAASRDPDVNPEEAIRSSRQTDPNMPLSAIVEQDGERMIPVDSLKNQEPPEGIGETGIEPTVAGTDSATIENEPVVAEAPVVAGTDSTATETPVVTGTDSAATETPVVTGANSAVTETDPVVTGSTVTVAEQAPIVDTAADSPPSEYVLSEPAPVYEDEPRLVVQEDAVESRADLVPDGMNPPITEGKSPLDGPAISVVPGTVAEKTPPVTTKPEAAVTKPVTGNGVTAEIKATPRTSPVYEGLPIVGSLQRGKYYVNLASYNDTQSAWKVVNDHAKKYPLAIERLKDDSLVMYVGPLNKDECGAVLERFKGFGFKGARVRKVK